MDDALVTMFKLDDQILLRPFKADDAEVVYQQVRANFDHLREFMHWMVPEYSLESAREFIAASITAADERKSLGFGIFQGAQLIGSIGFTYFDFTSRKTEIGYWIDKGHEGQGIISRSCRSLINYAFDEMDLNRIEIRCSIENVRSAAVPERLGFTEEGVLRQCEVRNGRLHDFAIYGLLRNEWLIESKC